MKNNQNGFSLLEIMAVLVIFSILLVPMLSSFTDAHNRNERSQRRRTATGIASGTIYGLDKIDFSEFRGLLDTANGNNLYYIELNEDNCVNLSADAQPLCTELFRTIWNSTQYDSATYKVYMFDYRLTTGEFDQLTAANNQSIKESVKESIENDQDIISNLNGDDIQTLIRVVIWIEYNQNPQLDVTLTGLIVDE